VLISPKPVLHMTQELIPVVKQLRGSPQSSWQPSSLLAH
jgi:hypothetical protein